MTENTQGAIIYLAGLVVLTAIVVFAPNLWDEWTMRAATERKQRESKPVIIESTVGIIARLVFRVALWGALIPGGFWVFIRFVRWCWYQPIPTPF
jgi:hypothetical protein